MTTSRRKGPHTAEADSDQQRATREDLAELHRLLAAELLARFKSYRERGKPVPAPILSVAERFIQDNSISAANTRLAVEQEEALAEVLAGLPGAEQPFDPLPVDRD